MRRYRWCMRIEVREQSARAFPARGSGSGRAMNSTLYIGPIMNSFQVSTIPSVGGIACGLSFNDN